MKPSRVILVGNCGSGWWPYESEPEQIGPTAGSMLFDIIREQRAGGMSFKDACRFIRREHPQLLPDTSTLGLD